MDGLERWTHREAGDGPALLLRLTLLDCDAEMFKCGLLISRWTLLNTLVWRQVRFMTAWVQRCTLLNRLKLPGRRLECAVGRFCNTGRRLGRGGGGFWTR